MDEHTQAAPNPAAALGASPHLPTHRLAIEVFSLDHKNVKQVAFLSELIYRICYGTALFPGNTV